MGNDIKIKFFNPQQLAHVSDQEAVDGMLGAIRTLESGSHDRGLTAKESAEQYRKTWQGMRLINDLVKRVAELEAEAADLSARLSRANAKIKSMGDSKDIRNSHDESKTKVHYIVDRDAFWSGLKDLGFDTDRILAEDRFREIVIPRAAVACSLLNHTTLIPQRVAQFMDRDRTTVLSYIRQHDHRMDHNAEYRQCYESASAAVMRLRQPITPQLTA